MFYSKIKYYSEIAFNRGKSVKSHHSPKNLNFEVSRLWAEYLLVQRWPNAGPASGKRWANTGQTPGRGIWMQCVSSTRSLPPKHSDWAPALSLWTSPRTTTNKQIPANTKRSLMLDYCRDDVGDGDPAVNQHWDNVWCWLNTTTCWCSHGNAHSWWHHTGSAPTQWGFEPGSKWFNLCRWSKTNTCVPVSRPMLFTLYLEYILNDKI